MLPFRRLDPIRLHSSPEIHLWHASLKYPVWSRFLPVLSDEELRRINRFVFERDARRYVVSHAVLRTVLGQTVGIEPGKVTLRTEAGGRPVIRDSDTGLYFSLSRSDERVLIGLAACPIGVDLEWLAAPLNVNALVEMVLSARERLAFAQTPPESRRETFLRCWTRKEAILKAAGQGLAISPATAEVLVASNRTVGWPITVDCLGSYWKVINLEPQVGYVGAVALALP